MSEPRLVAGDLPVVAAAPRRPVLGTAPGSRQEAFGPVEWGLLAAVAAIWGSSFLFIAVGLESLRPPVITFLRLALGAAALAAVPRARRPVDRGDLPRIAVLGGVWMAAPLLLFPVAQQWVASSVAGMLNGAMPLFTALIAALLLRRLPGRRQLVGLLVGFLGVVAITLPTAASSLRSAATGAAAAGRADASPLGVGLLLVAVCLYGLAANLAVPLQQRYGSLPVLLRAELVALLLVAPFAAVGTGGSALSWPSALAMLPLGLLGTGLAFVAMTNLVGRAGAARGSVAVYFIPLVAIALGVAVRGESVAPLALAGTALVVAGAWLTSRREVMPR